MCLRVNDVFDDTPSVVLDADDATPFASGFDDAIGGKTAFM